MNILRRFFKNFGIIKGTGILILALIAVLSLVVYLAIMLTCSYGYDAYRSFKRKSAKKRLVHA